MSTVTEQKTQARTVTSTEAQRKWSEVQDKALVEPVVITDRGRPRHVLIAYGDYQRLRRQERQVYRTAELPADLSAAILADLPNLRAPNGAIEDGDTIIE